MELRTNPSVLSPTQPKVPLRLTGSRSGRRAVSRFLGVLGALLLPMVAVSDSGLIERLEGYYATPSRICPQGAKSCDASDTDCMLIRKEADGHAKFYVYSVQENGSQCEVEGVAESRGDSLFYQDTDADSDDHGKGFSLVVVNGKVTFKYLAEPDPKVHKPPFCGSQARMDRVQFSLKDKQPLASQECGNGGGF